LNTQTAGPVETSPGVSIAVTINTKRLPSKPHDSPPAYTVADPDRHYGQFYDRPVYHVANQSWSVGDRFVVAGKLSANLTAKTIRIDGEVEGDITGKEKVVVTSTSQIKGNIVTPKMTLEEGARFKGTIDIDPAHANSSASPSPSVATSSKPASNSASSGSNSSSSGSSNS